MKHLRKFVSAALALVMILPVLMSAVSAVSYSVVRPSEGDYYIVCFNGGYAVDVTGGGDAAECTPIQLWEANQTDAQIWTLKHVGNGWYLIIHKRTGMVLNVQNGEAKQDGRLWLYPDDGTSACYWRFLASGSHYIIESQLGGAYVLDLHNNDSYSGALVHLWDLHGGPSALWSLTPVSGSGGASSNQQAYFPRYTGNKTSIVDALESIGADASLSYRKQIAEANGIYGYTGTGSQNMTLLNLLKRGALVRPGGSSGSSGGKSYFPRYTGSSTSIIDALKSVGAGYSYDYREQIARANGISGFTGEGAQNLLMLNLLKRGQLVKPDGIPAPAPGSSTSGNGVDTNDSYNVSVLPQSRENKPRYTNSVGQRSAGALNTVLDQFEVTSNSRYRRASNGNTYCNIFAWDVTSALGCQIPHWTLNNLIADSSARGAKEMNVNATYAWLNGYGGMYGWYKVSGYDAQQRADNGYPTVAVWKNPNGGSGHIAVVRPQGGGYSYSDSMGPVVAQAGASNYNYINVSNGFGKDKMSAVVYWTHD